MSSRAPVGDIPIALIGHDRGARVAHRLAVSGMDGFDIRGVCLIDIVQFPFSHRMRELHTDCYRSPHLPNGRISQTLQKPQKTSRGTSTGHYLQMSISQRA
jgi:pimeloyl-ACP methyl ester carboxylesterase